MAKAVKETFVAFQEYLMPLFAEKFTQKVTSTFIHQNAFDEAKKNCIADGTPVRKAGIKMLAQYDYAPEREKFLIDMTLTYIRRILRDHTQSHTTSPVFLGKLANQIAEMFSFYVMRKHNVPATEKAQNRLRLTVQAELYAKLFTDSDYAKALAAEHEAKQDLRRKPKSVQKKFKQAQQRAKAKAAHNFAREMNEMFIEAQCTPRTRR